MSSKNTSHSLLIGYYGFQNDGDDWLFSQVEKLLKTVDPITQIWSRQGHYYHNPSRKRVSVWRAFWTADRIVLGGGTLFQDSTSWLNVVYYASFCIMARWMNKPVWLIAQGVGPIQGAWSKWWTRWAFQSAEILTFRDQASIDWVNKHLKIDTVQPRLVADLAFYDATFIPTQDSQPTIGLSLRKGLGKKSARLAQTALSYLERSYEGIVADHQEDTLVLDALFPDSPQTSLSQLRASPQLFEGVITMRYHVALWASLNGIPFLAISRDPKLIALASELKQPLCHLDTMTMPDVFEKTLEMFLSSLSSLKDPLEQVVPDLIQRANTLPELLKERV